MALRKSSACVLGAVVVAAAAAVASAASVHKCPLVVVAATAEEADKKLVQACAEHADMVARKSVPEVAPTGILEAEEAHPAAASAAAAPVPGRFNATLVNDWTSESFVVTVAAEECPSLDGLDVTIWFEIVMMNIDIALDTAAKSWKRLDKIYRVRLGNHCKAAYLVGVSRAIFRAARILTRHPFIPAPWDATDPLTLGSVLGEVNVKAGDSLRDTCAANKEDVRRVMSALRLHGNGIYVGCT